VSSFRKPVDITRVGVGTLVKGQYTPGAETPMTIQASVQPLTGNEQETLPEGFRESGSFKLFTDFKLRALNQKTKEPGDRVTLDDKEYLVIIVAPWQNNVINHYKAIVSEAND